MFVLFLIVKIIETFDLKAPMCPESMHANGGALIRERKFTKWLNFQSY